MSGEPGLFVQDLGDQGESRSVRVFEVGDHDASETGFSGDGGGTEDVRFVAVFFD